MAKFDRIIPILVYEDIPSAHDFLVDAFGFAPGGVQRTPDGIPLQVRQVHEMFWTRVSP